MNQEKIKTIILGLLVGSVVSIMLGFTFGGWILGSIAISKGNANAKIAVAERLTPMCLAKFNMDPLKPQKLKEINAINEWHTENYVKDQG